MIYEAKTNEKKTRNWNNIILGIGFCLLGIIYLLILINLISYTENIFLQISNFTVSFLFMRIGSKLLRNEELERGIIACTIPTILFLSFTTIGSIISEIIYAINAKISLSTSMRTSFISIIISIAIVILLGLWVYLLVTYLRNPNIRLSDTNITNKIHTSKILSYLSPGFGKILVGNGWKKYSLFIIYILLQIFSSMSGIEWSGKTPFNLSEKVLSMIGPSFNWIVFKLIDGYYINKYETFMKKDTEKKESTLELPPVIDINQDFQGEP